MGVLQKQVDKMTSVAKKVADRGQAVDPSQIDVPYKGELRDAIFQTMMECFNEGLASVKREAKSQQHTLGLPTWAMFPEQIAQVFGAKAASAAGFFQTSMQAKFAIQILQWFDQAGDMGEQQVYDGVMKAVNKDVNGITGTAVVDSYNIGRGVQGRVLGAEQAQYSAIMDRGTCENCRKLDGKFFDVGSMQYDKNMPPLTECLGQDNCRCIYIYDFTESARDLEAASPMDIHVPPHLGPDPIEPINLHASHNQKSHGGRGWGNDRT